MLSHHSFRRMTLVVMILLLTVMLPPAPVAAKPIICFNEVPYCIFDPFATYWEQHGGLPVFGYPITPRFVIPLEGTYRTVQFFERARLELHPENQPPYNVLLTRLGDELLQRRGTQWQNEPRAPMTEQEGCRYFEQTNHLVCDAFLRYWQSHGLEFDGKRGFSEAESLALFGLPLTEARVETNSSGDTVLTQWFERARFELHTNLGPDVVLLGLLGREAALPWPEQCLDIPQSVNGAMAVPEVSCFPSEAAAKITIAVFWPQDHLGEQAIVILTNLDKGASWEWDPPVTMGSVFMAFTMVLGHFRDPGLYRFTVEGMTSSYKSVIYFRIM